MKYGISSYVWASPFSNKTLGLLKKAWEMGFDYFEICVEDPAAIDPGTILPVLKETGIQPLVCGAFGPERDVSSEEEQVRQQGMDYIKYCVDLAAELGSDMVSGPMYSATGKARLLSPAEREAQWKLAATNLKLCAQYARERGVRLAIETLNRFETDFLNTVDQGLELLDRIGMDNVGLLLDTFHLNIEETDMAAALKKAGDRLFNFHACSNTRGTPGEDHIDWQAIGRVFREMGYRRPIVIESFTTDITEIAKAVSLWRPVAASQDALAQNGLHFLKQIFG